MKDDDAERIMTSCNDEEWTGSVFAAEVMKVGGDDEADVINNK